MKNNSTSNIDITTPKTPTTPVIHILIVEDNPAIGKYLTNLLRKKGYKCLLAFNASEAMAQYQAYQIPLILLDLEIPGTHGVNIANQMRNLKKQQPTIIAFSKYHRDAMQFFALSNGIDAYIRDYRNQEDVITLITSNIPIPSFSRQSTTTSESFDLEPVTPPVLPPQDNITFKSFKCTIL